MTTSPMINYRCYGGSWRQNFMKDELFNDLLASVREGGAILRGEVKPSRSFAVNIPAQKRFVKNSDFRTANSLPCLESALVRSKTGSRSYGRRRDQPAFCFR